MYALRPSGPQGVCLAVPSYGAMSAAFVYALTASVRALALANIPHSLLILNGNCHVDDARNSLVRQFLSGDSTDLFFLDADISWCSADLLNMLTHDADVVAGVYPMKQDIEAYPCRLLKTDTVVRPDGLIEVEGVPGGFLRIRRHVLELMASRAQSYLERPDDATHTPLIFERHLNQDARFSGDYVFCRKWRELGGHIFVDAAIRFDHVGEKAWSGTFGEWLLRRQHDHRYELSSAA